MSEQIQQTLGFDASGALATLAQLNGSLAAFSAQLQSTAEQMRSFNSAGNQTSALLARIGTNAAKAAQGLSLLNGASLGGAAASVNTAATAYTNLGTAVGVAAGKVAAQTGQVAASTASNAASVAANVGKMTTSFQLLSRIVFTQAIVRGLSILRNTLQDVGGEAVDFQNKIALIRTIDDSGKSFQTLSADVRNLSDQFNLPLLDTAAGLYQTISNQVGNAAESLQFLNEAAKFAKATDSSLSDSVDLLSGAMKSFGKGVDDTGRIASVFFKTIDLGRITADNLANSFGRVGPQAGAIGLSVEEVGSAIAAISVKGSSSNESLTQLRGILTALVKPTDAMKATLHDLGFTSSESAVKTLGFTGVLKALADSANGSNEAFAKLFPNVRGLAGAISLTADDVKTLAADLDEMISVSNNTNTNKFLEATSTDAQKVTSDINKLKNALTVELGQAFLRFGVEMSDAIGGVDGLVSVIKASPPAIISMAGSLLTLAVAAKSAALAGGSISTAFGLALLAPAAAGFGKSLGSFVDDKIFEANFEKIGELIKADSEAMDKLRESAKESLDEAASADAERIKSAREASVEIVKSFIDTTDEAIAENKRLVKELKGDATDITNAYGKLSTAIKQAIADSEKSKEDSAKRVQSLQDQQSKSALESQLAGLNDAQKVYALSQKSAELGAQAAHLIASSSGNDAQTARGRQQADLAKQLIDQEASLAQKTGNNGLQAKAAGDAEQFFRNQTSAEQTLQKADESRTAQLEKQATVVDKIATSLKEQFSILLDNSGALDKQGKQFSDAEQAQRQAARDAAAQKIGQLSLSGADTKQLSNLGLSSVIAKLNSDLTKAPLELAFDATAGTKQVQDSLTQAFTSFKVKLQIETGLKTSDLENLLGKQLSSPDQIFKGADEAAKQAADIRKQLSDSQLAAEAQARLQNQISALSAGPQARANGPSSFGASPEALAALQSLVTLLTELADKSKLTAADLRSAEQQVNNFTEQTRASFDSRLAFNTTNDALDLMLGKLKELGEVQKQSLDPSEAAALKANLQQIEGILGAGGGNGIGQQFKDGAAALQSATAPATTIAENAARAQASYEAAARALTQAAQTSAQANSGRGGGGGGGQGFANGGLVHYFAGGGFAPKGTDTVPAMLSPGEFVVNAAATRQFYSQLVAINSGRAPVYRAEGGPASQTFNFGDINLVDGGNRNTARDFVNGVRRELRRSTSTL
jgi:TP901 family phage tail tape measure protein